MSITVLPVFRVRLQGSSLLRWTNLICNGSFSQTIIVVCLLKARYFPDIVDSTTSIRFVLSF